MILVKHTSRTARTRRTVAAVGLAATTLAACSSEPAVDADLAVLASFYPLQFIAEQVGGDRVHVDNLTPPGGEPHDLELSPATMRKISSVDVVLYQSGFQAAVDEAVAGGSPQRTVDAAPLADLHADEHDELDAEHEDEQDGHTADDGHDHGDLDPHFWLDPTRLVTLADLVATAFGEADPTNAAAYQERATALSARLAELDTAFADGLAGCRDRTVVTTHEAFGYLTHRYDLEQVGISSLDPETEPSPARLREVSEVIARTGATTVFAESAAGSKVADVLASDLGLTTAVLDPLESRTKAQLADGDDYLAAMTANLAALTTGLDCA